MGPRPHLFGLLPDDLARLLRVHGTPTRLAEARRIIAHVVALGRAGLPQSRPVPRTVAAAVERSVNRQPLTIVERHTDSRDGFRRYLLACHDGTVTEAVRIPLAHPDRFTACLSSQVGCAMGCSFCATGRQPFSRNLETWEMVGAFLAVRAETPGRLAGAVFMGQGEPFANYDSVIRAARILSHPCGGRIPAKAISISTVGRAREIRRFTREGHRFRLIVSLTSALPERRAHLLPAAARQPLAELISAMRDHYDTTGHRVRVAWVLLGGVNHGDDEIEALGLLNAAVPIRLNLIDVNDPRADGYRRATPAELASFRDALRTLGIPAVRRYPGGATADAACGMLAGRRGSDDAAPTPNLPAP